MASGGFQPNKKGKSEPKRQSNWQRSVSSDHDDAQSLNSLAGDMRINNWDFSDLRSTASLGGDSKHRKKSKGNPEREREQSLSVDSPPLDKKTHTPSSYPRTKITPNTPTSQRVALESLKQHMTFSDVEDQISTDGERRERNNERQVSEGKRRLHNPSFSRTDTRDDFKGAREGYRSNNMDYSSMNQEKRSDVEKVRRLIRNLQEQEKGYRGLLLKSLKTHPNDNKDEGLRDEDSTAVRAEAKDDSDEDTSVDLEVQTEESDTSETSQESRPRIESKLGIDSDKEVDEGDDSHGASRSLIENSFSPAVVSQENGENTKGATAADGEPPSEYRQELMRILREKEHQLQALMIQQEQVSVKRMETEKKLMAAQTRENTVNAYVVALSASQRVLEHQRSNQQPRQGATSWEVNGGENERGAAGLDRQLKSNIVGYPESDDEDNSNVREVENLPTDLQEIRQQLNYLKNEFSQVSEGSKNMETENQSLSEDYEQLQNKLHELQSKKRRMDTLLQQFQRLQSHPIASLIGNRKNSETSNIQSNTSSASSNPVSREQQQQKSQKQSDKSGASSNSINSVVPTSLQTSANEVAAATSRTAENSLSLSGQPAREASFEQGSRDETPYLLQEMQEKLGRLKEVQGHLDQLRGLVQFHQGQQEQAIAASEHPSAPGHSALHRQTDGEVGGSQSFLQQSRQQQQEQPPAHWPRQQGERAGAAMSSSIHNMAQLLNLAAGEDQGDEHSDEDNVSAFQSETQWSHLGPWDDDPEVQEKFRKLRSAREKLHQLQDLVALVQQSPDAPGAMPENLGRVAPGIEDETALLATQRDEANMSVNIGELPLESVGIPQREENLTEIEDHRAELVRLRKERAMLVEIQSQLKRIQAQTHAAEGEERQERRKEDSDVGKMGLNPTANTAVVTFASNDELYSKIRRQRILHEELRSRKKELEAIMTKDRNKKQYSRNQDNQSDTVSMNTDAYGNPASVDATMATWGGSTVDNLENITEDEDHQARRDLVNRGEDDEDDGYPSDGIVQAEEEEEENDTDNRTYTIEQDARQQTNKRKGKGSNLETRPKTTRQTYPQPHYSGRNIKESRTHTDSRSSLTRQQQKSRQEAYRRSEGWTQNDRTFEGRHSEWFRAIETRLSGLSSAVDVLLRRSEAEGRQLNVSHSQENAVHGGGLMSPVQDQMLQLQNQSLMLNFGQLVQAVTRQQGDIQYLQQQVQALHLQIQSLLHEHSFCVGPSSGAGLPSFLHTAQSNPAFSSSSSSNYNLQAAGALGTHTLTLNQQEIPSPLTQGRSAVPAPARDVGQILGILQPAIPPPQTSGHRIVSDLHRFRDHLHQRSSGNIHHPKEEVNEKVDDEDPVPRASTYLFDKGRNNKRKSGTQAKKLQSDPVSGRRTSVEQPQGQGSDGTDGHCSRKEGVISDFRTDGGGGSADFEAGCSSISRQSLRSWLSRLRMNQPQTKLTDSASDGNTLFDILRDAIYSEAASLISQNENRPHFLLELFRDMRQIDSDFMRQRTLYSMQELLRRNPNANMIPSSSVPSWSKVPDDATKSEQTESATSEDDEHIQMARLQEEIATTERGQLERLARNGSLRNVPFDYAEVADNISSLSTPTDGGDESPFFKDTLGETVLEFDSLKRAGEERQQLFHKILGKKVGGWRGQMYLAKEQRTAGSRKSKHAGSGERGQRKSQLKEMTTSATVDQVGESSVSDLACPRIDMKQLDRQIKDIMMQTIPLVKEHMDDICSIQLLNYIRCLVISLTNRMGSQDFVRFFQHQLASVLEETLQKFEGRKMRECGEDLLVDISDVLYNELAFFRLMQNLDNGNVEVAEPQMQVSEDESCSEFMANSSAAEGFDEEESIDKDNRIDRNINRMVQDKSAARGFRDFESKEEELAEEQGRVVDDAEVQDSEDKDEREHPYKIELAPSETKPFTRIGSDEDDDERDEEWSLNDPSETAVSRDSMLETKTRSQLGPPPGPQSETNKANEEDGAEKQDAEKPLSPGQAGEQAAQDDGDRVDMSCNRTTVVAANTAKMNGTLSTKSDTDSGEELVVDDLPERLTVPPAVSAATVNSDSQEFRCRLEEEQTSLSGLDDILASLGGMEELAGDEASVLDPDSFMF